MSNNTSDEVFIVHFHCSVTDIEDNGFEGCTELREVVLNDGLQTSGAGAFNGCKSLERITIPSTVTDIGERAFRECTKLREIVLNEGLVKIGVHTFLRCESLERISIPSTVTV